MTTNANGQVLEGTIPPLPPSADGRDNLGRFVSGNKAGRGNPHYRRLAEARTAVLEVVGPEQVKALFQKLLERALFNDNEAAKLVLSYAVGRPTPAVDADRADMHEFLLVVEHPAQAEALRAMMLDMDPAKAVAAIRYGQEHVPNDPSQVFGLLMEKGHSKNCLSDVAQEKEAKRKRR